MKTEVSLKELKKVDWSRYSVRQFSFFFWSWLLDGYPSYADFIDLKFKKLMIKYSSLERIYFRPQKTTQRMREAITAKLPDPSFTKNFIFKARKAFNQTRQACQQFIDKKLNDLSNEEVMEAFKKLVDECRPFIGAASSAILVIDCLSLHIQNKILLPKLKVLRKEKELNNLMGELSTPNEMIHYLQEELDLIKLASQRHKKNFPQLLRKHVQAYSKMHYFNTHRLWQEKDFLKRLNELKQKNLQEERKKIEDSFKEKNQAVKKIVRELNLTEEEKAFIESLRSLLFLRTKEELLLSLIDYCFVKMFKETAQRFHLSLNQLSFFTLPELHALYSGKKVDLENVNKRRKYSLLVYLKGKQQVFVGETAEKILKELVVEEAPKKFTGELKGTPAMKGQARGRAKIILHLNDLRLFKEGDILVAPNTNPAYVVAMKKASAIVTDEGGVTCHAAIVSRELKKPCVIGTKFATVFLKNNDFIEVNADQGVVRKVKK